MPPLSPLYFLAALPLVVVLGWLLLRRRREDGLAKINLNRRESSEVVGRATYVDGSRHIPVALALNHSVFLYENAFMHASLERQWIHEVEYEKELTTGQPIGDGTVMRLRCFSQAFEFILDRNSTDAWKTALPAHHIESSAR
jgi:hypothetical protein